MRVLLAFAAALFVAVPVAGSPPSNLRTVLLGSTPPAKVTSIAVRDATGIGASAINGSGWVLNATFRGLTTGLTYADGGCTVAVTSPAFSAGVATTAARTLSLRRKLRQPYPSYTSWYEDAGATGAGEYLVASDMMRSGDSGKLSCSASAYGSSAAVSNLTVTNNSARTWPRPKVLPLMLPYQVVSSSFHFELAVDHPYGRALRMADRVKVTITCGATSTVDTIDAMTASTFATASGNKVPVFAKDISLTGLTNGPCTAAWDVYPFLGDAASVYSSLTYGNAVSGWTPATQAMRHQHPPYMPFVKDAAGTYGYAFAYVDPSGTASASPQVSATFATAAANYYGDVRTAAVACQTWNSNSGNTGAFVRSDPGGCTIRLKAGTYPYTFGSSTVTTGLGTTINRGAAWLTIERDPAASAGSVIINGSSTSNDARKVAGPRTILRNVTITGLADDNTGRVIDNAAVSSQGEFAQELVLDGVTVNGFLTTSNFPINRPGLLWVINSTLANVGAIGNGSVNSRSALYLMAGSTLSVSSGTTWPRPFNAAGNTFSGSYIGASSTSNLPGDASNATWGTATLAADQMPKQPFWTSNKFLALGGSATQLTFPPVGLDFTGGMALQQTLIERRNDGSTYKGLQFYADGNALTNEDQGIAYLTIAGEGLNFQYDDCVAANLPKTGGIFASVVEDFNVKRDYYNCTTGAEGNSGLRVFNWPTAHMVGSSSVALFKADEGGPDAGNLAGEMLAPNSLRTTPAAGIAVGFTTNKSATGTNNTAIGAAGDYHWSSSAAAGAAIRIPAGQQRLPIDIDGTTRRDDGTGYVGVYEGP